MHKIRRSVEYPNSELGKLEIRSYITPFISLYCCILIL